MQPAEHGTTTMLDRQVSVASEPAMSDEAVDALAHMLAGLAENWWRRTETEQRQREGAPSGAVSSA